MLGIGLFLEHIGGQDVRNGDIGQVGFAIHRNLNDMEIIQVIGELGGSPVQFAKYLQPLNGVAMDGCDFGEVDNSNVGLVGFFSDFDFHRCVFPFVYSADGVW